MIAPPARGASIIRVHPLTREAALAESGMAPAVTGYHHFAPTVSDVEASAQWYERVFGVGDAGVLDTEAIEPAGPRVEIGPVGDRERHVVQARPPLIEELAGIAVVVMQSGFWKPQRIATI